MLNTNERDALFTLLGLRIDRGSTPPGLPVLLTVADVARLLCKSPKAVYTMVERGQLPGVFRPGPRQLRFRRDELLHWIRQGRVPTPGGTRR
jgi:excisionase family DNA binding protein